jgi:hypothetical protein
VLPICQAAQETVAVSTGGGQSLDDRELSYRQGDAWMAVFADTGGRLRAGKPRRVFAGHDSGESQEAGFDVSSDGKRFLMIKSDEASTLRQC